jgi:hypothetical protein
MEKSGESKEKRKSEFGMEGYQRNTPEGEFEDTGLEPMFKFPICDSRYYKRLMVSTWKIRKILTNYQNGF